jgi:hypothetical protein
LFHHSFEHLGFKYFSKDLEFKHFFKDSELDFSKC